MKNEKEKRKKKKGNREKERGKIIIANCTERVWRRFV